MRLVFWGGQSAEHGAMERSRKPVAHMQAMFLVRCRLGLWPGQDFLPHVGLSCPCVLGASRSQTINVIIMPSWADFCPVSSVTYCKDKSETHLSVRTSQPPVILTSKVTTFDLSIYDTQSHTDIHP